MFRSTRKTFARNSKARSGRNCSLLRKELHDRFERCILHFRGIRWRNVGASDRIRSNSLWESRPLSAFSRKYTVFCTTGGGIKIFFFTTYDTRRVYKVRGYLDPLCISYRVQAFKVALSDFEESSKRWYSIIEKVFKPSLDYFSNLHKKKRFETLKWKSVKVEEKYSILLRFGDVELSTLYICRDFYPGLRRCLLAWVTRRVIFPGGYRDQRQRDSSSFSRVISSSVSRG